MSSVKTTTIDFGCLANNPVPWKVFFESPHDQKQLIDFAYHGKSIRNLAKGLQYNTAKSIAYQMEKYFPTNYVRGLARRALQRRGIVAH